MHSLKVSDVSGSDCLSELEIDLWRAGELSAAQAQRCSDHVAQCAACRDKQLAIEQADAALFSAAPSFDALRTLVATQRQDAAVLSAVSGVRDRPSAEVVSVSVLPRPRTRVPAVGASLAAVALAALGFLALRSGLEPGVPGDTRVKGGEPRLGFYVKHGDEVRRGEPGESVRPGDALRFVYTSDRTFFIALFSRDARELSLYYPEGEHAIELAPGQDAALDFSVELDATPGTERVIALFCPQTFELEVARAALASTRASDRELPSALAACHRVETELHKQSAREHP